MSNLVVFGLAPDWLINWLSPIWLISLGTALGLGVLFALWGIFWVLSSIGPLRPLAENAPSRRVLVGILGILFSAPLIWAMYRSQLQWAAVSMSKVEATYLAAVFLAGVGFALAYLAVTHLSPRHVSEIPLAITEGVMWPVLIVAILVAAFSIPGYFVARKPSDILRSLGRLPYCGITLTERTLPAAASGVEPEAVEIPLSFRSPELRYLSVKSNESLEVSGEKPTLDRTVVVQAVLADQEYRWDRIDQSSKLFPEETVTAVYIKNMGSQDAQVRIVTQTQPEYPEVSTILLTAAVVCGAFLFYLLIRTAMPKASAVALATTKSETAQPLFSILMLVGVIALVIFVFLPYHTLGEDIKMLKITGLVTILSLAIFQAIWSSGTSIAEEIEGRTALTVLSKPLNRRSFIVGKFLGIFWTILILFVILGLIFLVCISYKSIYESRESSEELPTWQVCHFELVRAVPGLALIFMETMVLAAISVAISTRLPMIANFVICIAIYVLGHLTPLIVQSSVKSEAFGVVIFVAQFIATLIPMLEYYDIQAAVSGGVDVPYDYLGWAFLYTGIYGMIALLLALFLFEDRDLA